LLAGAVNVTFALTSLIVVAVPIVGAPGTVATTLAVALEIAELDPSPLVPVTTHLIGFPTSAATKVYVLDVAPDISTPLRCHLYEIVGVLVQVPSVVDKVDPKLAVPLTTGAKVLTGGFLIMSPVCIVKKVPGVPPPIVIPLMIIFSFS
jgi:hypothetical protein